MPTSTVWRRRSEISVIRANSPVRPPIERCSPEPVDRFPTTDHYNESTRSPFENQRTQGLGLSLAPFADNIYSTQPDHLYIDQNGGAHVGARNRSANYHGYSGAKGGRSAESRQNGRRSKTIKSRGHTRSGSTIDDLANAAIATSPTFANGSHLYSFGSPSNIESSRPATSYTDSYKHDDHFYDRPSKRIKSEKLHAVEWSPREDRPRTSHTYEYQSPKREEAELLLSLSRSWGAHVAPVPPPTSVQEEMYSAPADETLKPEDQHIDDTVHSNTRLQTTLEIVAIADEPVEIEESDTLDEKGVEIEPADCVMEDIDHSLIRTTASAIDQPPVTEDSRHDSDPAQPTPAEQLQQGALKMPPEVEVVAPSRKVPRKIRPEVQAEVCATCQKLQRDGSDEDTLTHWIGCEHCKKWYHAACAGFKDKQEARSVDRYFCGDCEPQHGKTTFVRKSSRARTAIDYAGLNQGVVKPSDNSTMHHYIQPIKDGRIKVLPDDFARVRPDLLTAEFWENMDGMKRPFVVPACWNPRFGVQEEGLGRAHGDPKVVSSQEATCIDSEGNVKNFDNLKDTVDDLHNRTRSDVDYETVIDCDQDYLDMIMPRGLTVRKVADLFGPHEPVPVIDVKSQETKGAFTLSDWAEYYELDGDKPIRNVISLEVSNSRLGRLIRRPRVVRDIDLEDHVWDHESRSASNKRPVQFYCLMSVADSYTDFHIDFGGSSVYYHILKGVKTFFFIPPEDKYLKKYEEWCNSDTQNETWLGDLCGGNVTRVDLHEGDTAFIPAGWIHSVWTPEDSLVIGGNFLTRLDYELQLKVANVEKTTKVPLKFRYPFFQKVMWFTLLKYLEEDPVPEEVLRDFHEEPDYRFLRANPSWLEIGELANNAEPGEAEYHARTYPKSELNGLPALRDYLYRTARINADLPVPDINKRQIDAVKSSIPKGFGDPMQLIKTFAVWCAWKIGNETAPEWVHSDFGLLAELREREKAKKSETFRVPPERVSARKASQVQNNFTVEDTVTTPSKTTDSSNGDESGKKQRSGSKVGGSRVACEPCRQRRVRCRHKEDDVSPSNESPGSIRPRAYSNVSVEIPRLASTSPAPNGIEEVLAMEDTPPDFGSTSDLAQAALATLNSQSSDPNQFAPSSNHSVGSKKGRSKACEECRKSKRRCVHDEYGRVDPAKAAEPAKPRGSVTKRASRQGEDNSVKKVKLEGELDPALTDPHTTRASPPLDINAMIDPALMGDSYTGTFDDLGAYNATLLSGTNKSEDPPLHSIVAAQFRTTVMNSTNDEGENAMEVTTNGVTSPMILNTNPEASTAAHNSHLQTPDHDIDYSPITVDEHPLESTEALDVDTTDVDLTASGSRHSSRQSKPIERYIPVEHRSPTKTVSKLVKREHRSSSSAISEHTNGIILNSQRSSSNTSGTIHQMTLAGGKRTVSGDLSGRPVSRGSTAESDVDADERMARELQAAENGLRRRASVRA